MVRPQNLSLFKTLSMKHQLFTSTFATNCILPSHSEQAVIAHVSGCLGHTYQEPELSVQDSWLVVSSNPFRGP